MNTEDIQHPVWRKSARSFANNDCVEVARLGNREVGLRDSKLRTRRDCPILRTDTSDWEAFTALVKDDA